VRWNLCGNDQRQCEPPRSGSRISGLNVAEGSTAASHFADLTAALRSFELDCQAADIRGNPRSANCSLRIDQEIGMSMTGIKVLR